MSNMDFGQALTQLKAGYRVSRTGWNGKGMFVYLVPAASYPAQRRAYLAMSTVDGDVVPWVASQTDILASDWEIAE